MNKALNKFSLVFTGTTYLTIFNLQKSHTEQKDNYIIWHLTQLLPELVNYKRMHFLFQGL